MSKHESVHTDWRDCELPETASDGDTVVCEGCGREWDYKDGWFTLATDGGARRGHKVKQ